MKIVFDQDPGEDIEEHARMMHTAMLREKKLPRIAGATRALIPGWCDECGEERAWVPIMGGAGFCAACRGKRETRQAPGFSIND